MKLKDESLYEIKLLGGFGDSADFTTPLIERVERRSIWKKVLLPFGLDYGIY